MGRAVGIGMLCVVAAVLFVTLAQATANDTQPVMVCVSAVGPVDQYGQGDTTPETRCEP